MENFDSHCEDINFCGKYHIRHGTQSYFILGLTRIGTTATSPRIPTFGTSSVENSNTDEISAESAHEYYCDFLRQTRI